jgi:PAS domain S-box-containing protein
MEARDREKILLEQFSQAVLASADGYIAITRGGDIIRTNKSLEKMTGYREDQLKKMRIWDLQEQENRDASIERINRILSNGSELFESRWMRADGDSIEIEVSATLETRTGIIASFVRDVT